MEEQTKKTTQELSDDELKEVSGGAGNNIQQQRLDHLDNQSKSVEDIQAARLDHLDNQSK
ncbi:MAG: bacteriocin [Leptolyngbya sp. SIO4C1]|nr:bacteriocin [Leptolyngbya sp. SIO4C1]